jgi:cytoskeletal protein CcmA (bactofilin family)
VWNKRREEEPPRSFTPTPPKPAPVAPNPVEFKENTPVSSMPVGRMDDARPGSATIGKAVKVVGQIFSKEDLYVDGEVEGTVEATEHKLIIGPNGAVHAAIKAREVVALGSIQGNVEATEKIEIRKDARLVGDIRTARIIIEDGAYFKGSIDIVKPEPAKNAARQAPAVANPPIATAAPATAGAQGENKR